MGYPLRNDQYIRNRRIIRWILFIVICGALYYGMETGRDKITRFGIVCALSLLVMVLKDLFTDGYAKMKIISSDGLMIYAPFYRYSIPWDHVHQILLNGDPKNNREHYLMVYSLPEDKDARLTVSIDRRPALDEVFAKYSTVDDRNQSVIYADPQTAEEQGQSVDTTSL